MLRVIKDGDTHFINLDDSPQALRDAIYALREKQYKELRRPIKWRKKKDKYPRLPIS